MRASRGSCTNYCRYKVSVRTTAIPQQSGHKVLNPLYIILKEKQTNNRKGRATNLSKYLQNKTVNINLVAEGLDNF